MLTQRFLFRSLWLSEDSEKHCVKNEWTLSFELMSFIFEGLCAWVTRNSNDSKNTSVQVIFVIDTVVSYYFIYYEYYLNRPRNRRYMDMTEFS